MSTSVGELHVGSCERLVSAVRDIFEPAHRIVIVFPQCFGFFCSTLLNNRIATFDKNIYSLLVLFSCTAKVNTKTVQNQPTFETMPFSALNSHYAFKVHIYYRLFSF